MSVKRAHYSRKFLNNSDTGGIALIEAVIEEIQTHEPRDKTKPLEKHFDASLTIGDCNRTITLDFSCWGAKSASDHLQKIALLRRTITAFEAVLAAQIKEVVG